MDNTTQKAPSLLDALLPMVVLIALLAASVILFKDDTSYGRNQIALFIAAAVAVVIGLKNGHSWQSIEQAMVNGISLSLAAVLILLAVGALIGTGLLS